MATRKFRLIAGSDVEFESIGEVCPAEVLLKIAYYSDYQPNLVEYRLIEQNDALLFTQLIKKYRKDSIKLFEWIAKLKEISVTIETDVEIIKAYKLLESKNLVETNWKLYDKLNDVFNHYMGAESGWGIGNYLQGI